MKRGKRIRPGRHLIVDDRSGITRWDDQTTKDWDGLIITRGQEDGEHPQWFVRSLQDPYPIHEVRPLQGTNFDTICGAFAQEYIPRTTIKRQLSQTDLLKPLPGIGAMAIGDAANECGHWFVIGPAETQEAIFPAIMGITTGNNILQTTHTINLPDGINAGIDRMLVMFASENSVDLSLPAGWPELKELDNTTVTLHIFYRDIDGTEGLPENGASITVTSDVLTTSSYIVYRLESYDPATAPQISTGATGSSTSADPDEIILPSTDNWLSISIVANEAASTEATKPASYKNQTTSRS